jgi:glutamyl-tRNA(Gln) amidotransferase subunit E
VTRRYFKREAAPPAPIDLNPRTEPALHFPWREFGDMTDEEYDEIGFLCGLEVHQQLHTKRKLFCRCPAGVYTDRVDAEVLRHMRPTLSELGQYDGCALMEFKTEKQIVYRLARTCVCTYEMDDTPPFPIDDEAVKQSLEIATMFGMALVSELQVMRKQYLDGSIPTGFQRTGMIAVGGEIPFRECSKGPDSVLRLRQLTLEEDSCREISDIGHKIVFKTDRLGMPLIETVTEPDFITPRDVATGGRLLASVARASGKVRRGIGSARQDVNVSIAGSRRVEIKGVPQHKVLPKLVHIEAFRQLELLRIRETLRERGCTHEMLLPGDEATPWNSSQIAIVNHAVGATTCEILQDALAFGDTIVAVRLPHFAGTLALRTQPGIVFAQEFRERLRVIACLTARPFMTHTDEDVGIEDETWAAIREAVGAEDGDAVIVAWGPEHDAATACREILIRAQDALIGVPSETRQMNGDCTTGLERILPGPERMYPDTDTPQVRIPDAWVAEVERVLQECPWQREDRYLAMGMPAPTARRLASSEWASLFDALAPSQTVTATRLAHALEKRIPHLRRSGILTGLPDADRLAPLVRDVDEGTILPEAFEAALEDLLRDPEQDADLVLALFRGGDDDDGVLEERLAAVTSLDRTGRLDDDALMRRALGEVMPFVLGRASIDDIRAAVTEALGSVGEGSAS